MRIEFTIFIVLMMCGIASAGFTHAVDTSSKISNILDQQTYPYNRTITMSNLNQIGYDTETMVRPGTYAIMVKSASYDSTKGILILNLYAWHNGTQLKTHSPWNFYMPFALDGSTDSAKLTTFLKLLVKNLEYLPYGEPIGDDSGTFYAEDNTEETQCSETSPTGSFSTLRSGGGDVVTSLTQSLTSSAMMLRSTTTNDQYDILGRIITIINTSSIQDGSTIDTAYFNIHLYAKTNGLGSPGFGITGGAISDTSAISAGDFDAFTDVRYSNDKTYSGMGTEGYNNFTLNDYGEGNISDDSFTVIFGRLSWDIDNSFGGTWASATSSGFRFSLPYRGSSYRAYLYVEWTPGEECSIPDTDFTVNETSGYPPFTVAFTDTTTNSPDNWDWYFGDDSKDSDTQNPTWLVNSVIGNSIVQYDVKLYASNATCGGSWENKSGYIDAYPLTASFTANTTSGCAPLTVAFTDTTDDGVPTSWTWNFSGLSSSSTQNPVYTFENEGLYYVWLNASNSYSWDIQNSTELINVTSNCTTPTPTPTPTPTYSGGISIISYGKDYILYDIGNNSIVSLDGLETIPNGHYLGYYDLTPGTEHIICDETGINCTGIVTKPDTYTVLLRYGAYLLLLALCIVCYKYPITAFPSFIYGTYLISSYLPNIGADFIEYVFVGIILVMSILAATVGWRKIS